MEEFKKTPIEGLECTIDGRFRKSRTMLKVQYPFDDLGRARRAIVKCKVDGVQTTLGAAIIVARTWAPSLFSADCIIDYKDGNKHNIHCDNLIFRDRQNFYREHAEKYLAYKPVNCDAARASVERRFIETKLARDYLYTGDFTDINRYVKDILFRDIVEYALKKSFSMQKVQFLIPDVISRLYEMIYANRPIVDYTGFCRRLVSYYRKKGCFGKWEYYSPRVIDNVSQLNLDSLCKKYRCTKIK